MSKQLASGAVKWVSILDTHRVREPSRSTEGKDLRNGCSWMTGVHHCLMPHSVTGRKKGALIVEEKQTAPPYHRAFPSFSLLLQQCFEWWLDSSRECLFELTGASTAMWECMHSSASHGKQQ
uniref:Uncharacterized protein n=1 Tax=Ditylenchus dipsaci TaxID=166011 RepID=A0A915D287_9BILA